MAWENLQGNIRPLRPYEIPMRMALVTAEARENKTAYESRLSALHSNLRRLFHDEAELMIPLCKWDSADIARSFAQLEAMECLVHLAFEGVNKV